jgi:hypothetical protein
MNIGACLILQTSTTDYYGLVNFPSFEGYLLRVMTKEPALNQRVFLVNLMNSATPEGGSA